MKHPFVDSGSGDGGKKRVVSTDTLESGQGAQPQ
jgi:hypothetical protein